MLIYGHKLTQTPKFCWVQNDEFQKNAINCFVYDENLIEKAKNAGVEFGILAKNSDEILLANALGAKFLLIDSQNLLKNDKKLSINSAQKTSANLAKKASKMAEFYLFDSKILLLTNSLDKLEKAYKMGVDGVILKDILKVKQDNKF